MLWWFERKKTFSEIPVVDGWSAMLWKLAGSAGSGSVIGRTRWHELQSLVAICRPDAGSPSEGCASAGNDAVNSSEAAYGNVDQCIVITVEQVLIRT